MKLTDLEDVQALTAGSSGNFLKRDGTIFVGAVPAGGGSTGTVALTMPGIFAVTSPVIVPAGGTLAVTFNNQAANTFFAGPTSGGAAVPTMRALVAADVPALMNILSAYSAGTNFALPNSGAACVFTGSGAISPKLTLITVGTWLIFSGGTIKALAAATSDFNAAFSMRSKVHGAGAATIQGKVITNSFNIFGYAQNLIVNSGTVDTPGLQQQSFVIPPFQFANAFVDDTIEMYGNSGGTPFGGTGQLVDAWVLAWLKF